MTNAEQERVFRERELEFFGSVTASISHDLNNTIAIIEQTAGLLEDLIAACNQDQNVGKEQLQKIVDRIGKQTKRGAKIVRKLNAFAHSIDDTERELDLNELVQNVIALANRLAEQKRVRLGTRPADGRITVSRQPFRTQQALFLTIQETVSLVSEASQVVVSTGKQGSTAWITVESELSSSAQQPDLSYLEMLMRELNGEVESRLGDGRVFIRLKFHYRSG